MADDISLPGPSEVVALEDGRPNSTWWRVWQRLVTSYNQTVRDLSSASTTLATKAAQTQPWSESLIIEFPENGDYVFPLFFPVPVTITDVTTVCVSGTCTLTTKINTTALGGTANSVSSSRQSQAQSSSNVSAADDDLTLTVSSNSACQRMSVTLKGTAELA